MERGPPPGGPSATRGYQRATAPAPEGAAEASSIAVPPPLQGGLAIVPEHHGFRPPQADSTRGYSPAPLRGESAGGGPNVSCTAGRPISLSYFTKYGLGALSKSQTGSDSSMCAWKSPRMRTVLATAAP